MYRNRFESFFFQFFLRLTRTVQENGGDGFLLYPKITSHLNVSVHLLNSTVKCSIGHIVPLTSLREIVFNGQSEFIFRNFNLYLKTNVRSCLIVKSIFRSFASLSCDIKEIVSLVHFFLFIVQYLHFTIVYENITKRPVGDCIIMYTR